ncbi:MAG: hypothetical protein WC969_13610 [Elusimicrobiota bacterium]
MRLFDVPDIIDAAVNDGMAAWAEEEHLQSLLVWFIVDGILDAIHP